MNSMMAMLIGGLVIASVICMPLLVIYAMNALFSTNLDYSLINYVSVFILMAVVGGVRYNR